nr:M23 family metallopeptidase [Cohnella candidum]
MLHKPQSPATPRSRLARRVLAVFLSVGLLTFMASPAYATDKSKTNAPDPEQRLKKIYDQVSRKTGMPWQEVAAIDKYERALSRAHRKTRPLREGAAVGVFISEARWAGELNPDPQDDQPVSIRFFGGVGRDGSGDGIADRGSDVDLLYTVASRVKEHGSGPDDFAIGLWEYYHNTRSVQRILQFVKILEAFGRQDLTRHAFPLPIGSNYSYRSTWGDSRGWGGYRIHEGTDIFAGYGVPVRSTTYGIVELKGWNRYGGWRIGIRDLDNLYHYYAHLQGFEKNLKPGDVVQPGQVIGWVGSSGYGRPGTSGKFPPHLHYGVYRDRGLVEWAFDPYPMLRKWEREERKALRVTR